MNSIAQLIQDSKSLLAQLIEIPSFSREEDQTADCISTFLIERGISNNQVGNNVIAYNKYFDESKVGTSLTGKYICHEDTVNNSVVNYEIKSFSNNSLTIKRIDDKNATYTNTFYNE